MSEQSKPTTSRSGASVAEGAAPPASAERQRSPLLRRWSVADLIAEAAARLPAREGCPAV